MYKRAVNKFFLDCFKQLPQTSVWGFFYLGQKNILILEGHLQYTLFHNAVNNISVIASIIKAFS